MHPMCRLVAAAVALTLGWSAATFAEEKPHIGPMPRLDDLPKDYRGTVVINPALLVEDALLPPVSIGRIYLVDDRADTTDLPPVRKTNVYREDEPIRIRAVLDNVGHRGTLDGLREYEVVADVKILAEGTGEVLFERDKMQTFSGKGALRDHRVFLNLSLTLSGLPPGTYVIGLQFHDLTRTVQSRVDAEGISFVMCELQFIC